MLFFQWMMMDNHSEKKKISVKRRLFYGAVFVLGGLLLLWVVITSVIFNSFRVPIGSMMGTILPGDYILCKPTSYPPGRLPERGTVIAFIFPGNRDEVEADVFQYYLKRCVAVAGDMLEVRDGYVYIDGVKETLPPHAQFQASPHYSPERDQYVTFPAGVGYTRDNWGPMRVPKKGDVIPLDATNVREWQIFVEREGHSVQKDGVLIEIDGSPVRSYTVERDYVFGMGDNRNDSQDSRYWGFIPVENITDIPVLVAYSKSPDEEGMRWERIGAEIE